MEPVSCCPPGSHGRAASDSTDTKGQTETWHLDGKDIPVYTVGPSDAALTVVFVHDIFSMHEGRVKSHCDFLAELGYRVVFPDWHKGDSLEQGPDFMTKIGAWLGNHPVDELVRMVTDTCNKVRGEGKKLVTIGFCWGTWVLYNAQKAGVAMDGCICMHPSLVIEDMQGRSHSELLKAQNCPVMVAAAGNDAEWTKPGTEWEESSKALGFAEKSKFYLYPDMQHGWTNRGDIKDEKIARDVNLALS